MKEDGIQAGDCVRLHTGDEWDGLYGIVEDVWRGELFAVFCVTMAAFGYYVADISQLEKFEI